jgi:hypothetical protein
LAVPGVREKSRGTATSPNNNKLSRAAMLAPATPKANAYRTTKHVSQREKEKIVQLFDIERERHRVI